MLLPKQFACGLRPAMGGIILLTLLVSVAYYLYNTSWQAVVSLRTGSSSSSWWPHRLTSLGEPHDSTPGRKPPGIGVSGLVFYGRRDRAACLRCYLDRNLVDNGGWLEEVLFLVNTDDEKDLEYLEEIIASNPQRYKKLIVPGEKLWIYSLYKAWQRLERGRYYVKVDDDIVWIADDAIPRIVSRKMQHPHDFAVSANIINNPPLGFMHHHLGALHPYFPDIKAPKDDENNNKNSDSNSGNKKTSGDANLASWRPSRDPPWDGPSDYTWPLDRAPPHKNHRWLRVRNETMMGQTPAASLTYEVWGPSYESWAIAAQMHYSLLENMEGGDDGLDAYKFHPPWDMGGERIRINLICVYGDDILDTNPANWTEGRSDEDMLAIDLPKRLRRPVIVVGEALAAHYQYGDQRNLSDTDVLARYQSLAKDRACLSK
ncbi:hypothetical protein JDV02_010452 [Purpureocillium takamizusanense]|uniref:Uncharacterized protein n=1 Tax=Purpureocillium takamizusanense TaxID=2060973 RepID=A0A9Q8QUI2_9HYPO|nr:uncharacterized protein JDV02_010452 [Purpureocillium takamizusanense]UNI24727.1 hypothetical protein JDV02_010452 [Purpureocillium takamizusanense]